VISTGSSVLSTADLVSPHVGIVHRLDDGLVRYDHPRLASVYAQVCDTRAIFDVAQDARAGGLAASRRDAVLAALGESIERYSACHVPRSRLRVASVADLGAADVVSPHWREPSDQRDRVSWVLGTRLAASAAGQPAWIAASRVYLSEVDDLGAVVTPTSTGLACHTDPWRALRSGLLEVIERDAVMTTWLSRARVRPVDCARRWRTPSGREVRFDRAVERYEVYLLDSPVGVPVAFAVAYGAERQPAAAVGAAAHLDVASACRRALVEAAQTFGLALHLLARGTTPAKTPAEVRDLDDHVAYYLPAERVGAFDFLRSSTEPPVDVDLDAAADDEPERDIRTIVARAGQGGLPCYAVDVTAPDVRVAGLWAVRAVIPGLYPLIVGGGPPAPHPRLDPTAAVNPDPHPFP